MIIAGLVIIVVLGVIVALAVRHERRKGRR